MHNVRWHAAQCPTTTAGRVSAAPKSAAVLYSLLETAKLKDVEPIACLYDAVVAARRGKTWLPQ